MPLEDMVRNMQGLQALSDAQQQHEMRQKAYDQNTTAQNALRQYQASLQSGTPDNNALNTAVLNNPDLAKNVLDNIGIQEKHQAQDAANFSLGAYQNMDNPDAFYKMLHDRVNYLSQNGRDPKDTLALGEQYASGDVDGAKKNLQTVMSALTNQGYINQDMYKQVVGIQPQITPVEQAKLDQGSRGLDLEQQRVNIERDKAAQGKNPKALDAKDIQQIQQDVSKLIQPTQDVYKAAQSMDALKTRNSPLAMQAAIIQFNKALDPGSVVRTEEGKIVSDSGGAMQGLIAKYNDAIGKGKLSPAVMADIVDTAKSLSDSAVDSSTKQIADYIQPYGETIPENLKTALSNRVPKKFKASAPAMSLMGEDKQAYDWAKANPTDPRSSQILKKLGAN